MRKIPEDVMQKLRSLDCNVVAGWLCLRGGRNRRWFCPSCQTEKSSNPDLSTPARGGFTCHKCRAKGDAFSLVALTRSTSTEGRDFFEIVEWLASQAGLGDITEGQGREAPRSLCLTDDFIDGLYDSRETPIPPAAPSPPVNEGPRLSSDDAAAIWAECKTRRHPHALAWLAERGIPADVIRSDVALLDDKFAHELSQLTTLWPWLRKHIGAAIVAPLRSAATSKVGALHVRAFNPSDGGDKRRTCGQKSDEDGTPRGYGLIGDVCNAQAIVLVEGMADTFAAEALLYSRRDVVIVGVDSITAFPTWAQWINAHNPSARVVIVRHNDGAVANKAEREKKLRHAVDACHAIGARASLFRWGAFAKAMETRGLNSIRAQLATGEGFDITDTVQLVTQNGEAHFSRFETLAAVFTSVVGLPASAQQKNTAAPHMNNVNETIAETRSEE